MVRLRDLRKSAKLSCLFYMPAFILNDQYVQIWPSTRQTIGAAVLVMIILIRIFMPFPLMIAVVLLTMVGILIGMFGFMYYWDLTLSSITMIQLVMSVGFSVDFSVHICHAFLVVRMKKKTKSSCKSFDMLGGHSI